MNPVVLTAKPWQLRPVDRFNQGLYPHDDDWLSQDLPAHWQDHRSLRYHSGKVVYRHRFDRPELSARRRYWLRAEGIFYWSRLYFNGRAFPRHEGYFMPQEYEVTGMLADCNELLIEVDCPEERRKSGKRMLTGVFSHWDALDPMANPGGIWLPVVLEESGPVRLRHLGLSTQSFDEHAARLRYSVEVDSLAACEVELRWSFTPHNFDGPAHHVAERQIVRGGVERVEGDLTLPEPRLWWTHDLGEPHLYDVALEIHCFGSRSDERTLRFGVRTFEFRDFIAYLNGQRFLVKGNNYPPTDTRIASTTPERVREDLGLARRCHMNMLRVHAHVGHPALYDAADEIGILLWQDFPMQWTYRRTVEPHARRQVAEMLRLLGNHPSIAVWCMHNEPIFITDTKDERIITGLRVYFSVFVWSWNRDVLDRRIARIARRLDPTRPVISNSGEFAVPFWHRGNDTHFYFGWYIIYGRLQGLDTTLRRFRRNARFVTEFGAQSFPNKESCLKFMPENMLWIDWKLLSRRYSFQPNVMQHWYDWRAHRSLDALIEQSQRYQSEVNRFYIDRLRLHKYRPTGGIVPFMLVDSNPAVQWSIIDYWRVPKASYWAMQDAFRPRYVFTLISKPRYRLGETVTLPIYGVNDARCPASYRLHAAVFDPESHCVAAVDHVGEWAADCMSEEIGHLRFAANRRGQYEVRLVLDSAGERFTNRYTVLVGRQPRPRGVVQRLAQALAASVAALPWSAAPIR